MDYQHAHCLDHLKLSDEQLQMRGDLVREHGLSLDDATAVARGDRKASDFGIMEQAVLV
ncbi:hypothetical protein KW797_04010 [Candidatus Parcubacteria bacterium]|nr:hypothetical protein [Candidatus Parcubacteria bacterium]